MKKIVDIIFIFLAFTMFARAFEADCILYDKEKERTFRARVVDISDTQITYKNTTVASNAKTENLKDFETIYFATPKKFSQAYDLFSTGNYEKALKLFVDVKQEYLPTAFLSDNFHTLSAFYEMECLRHLERYDDLFSLLKIFQGEPLMRDDYKVQLDLYRLWEAVHHSSWQRVLELTLPKQDQALPGYQRAQVAFCRASALEQEGDLSEALVQYHMAITADAGAAPALAQKAASKILEMYLKDPDVSEAMKRWGTKDEERNSPGFIRLLEAGDFAFFYKAYLSEAFPLPKKFKKLLKYSSSELKS